MELKVVTTEPVQIENKKVWEVVKDLEDRLDVSLSNIKLYQGMEKDLKERVDARTRDYEAVNKQYWSIRNSFNAKTSQVNFYYYMAIGGWGLVTGYGIVIFLRLVGVI